MPSRKVNLDFYAVGLPEGETRGFAKVLADSVDGGRRPSKFAIRYGEDYVRMQDLEEWLGYWRGSFLRIRMYDIPGIANLTGGLTPLTLQPNEGVGEQTYFLYSPNLNTMVLQRNRSGVGLSLATLCLESYTSVLPITLSPILTLDAYQRLVKFGYIRGYSVTFAPASGVPAKGTRLSLGGLITAQREMQAGTMSVDFSVGRNAPRDKSLNREEVLEDVQTLLAEPDRIRHMTVKGRKLPEDKIETVDLVQDRIKETVDVKVVITDQNTRELDRDECFEKLKGALSTRRKELAAIFGIEE